MDTLAAVCDRVASRNDRRFKVGVLAEWFRTLSGADLARAVRFVSGSTGEHRPVVGSVKLRDAVMAVTQWDIETVNTCLSEVGDTGETVALLLEGHTAGEALTLAEAEHLYLRLAAARRTAQKVEILRDVFARYRPPAVKYFVKVMRGPLRIGLQPGMVEEALTAAGHMPDRHPVRLFHPFEFMMATPVESSAELGGVEHWWIERERGGTRAQLHVAGGNVKVFACDGKDITRAFPNIVDAARSLPGRHAIDGELIDGRGTYAAWDLLHSNGEPLVEAPIETRRARLSELLAGVERPLSHSPLREFSTQDDLQRFYEAARAEGFRGIVCKRRLSGYEPGRSSLWLALAHERDKLSVVITTAQYGTGRSAALLADYTFAVRDGDRLANVGRALADLPEAELRQMTPVLRGASIERFGRVMLVRPLVVLEVAFDGVQKSPRRKGGYALRSPRILRWRRDKGPEEADTLERVRELHDAAIG